MTKTAFKTLCAALLVAAALQGCSLMHPASQRPNPPSLTDTAWTLVSLSGTTQSVGLQATLRFAEGHATGSDGCNRFVTTFTAVNGKLELGADREATQMTCPEPANQLAAAFNRALDDARRYRIEAGTLLLLDAGGATLASLAAQPDTLAGTDWDVSSFNNGNQAVVSVITDTRLTMEFLGDGKLRGSGGCNSFDGSFTAEGNTLTIARVTSTRMFCEQPEGRMAQEVAFLAALETVTRVRREADRLELRTASGALAVSARQAESAKP